MGLVDVHHPLTLVFGILGNLVSIAVLFSPMPIFIKIYKRKSTMEYSSIPYVVSLFSALLWLFYSLVKKGDTFFLLTINIIAVIIQSMYLVTYIVYATPQGKKQTLKNLSVVATLFIVISFGCSILLLPLYKAPVVGWICVAVSVCVFASPLANVVRVVKTENIESMPFPLSCCLTLTAIIWFAYGVVTVDICVSVPNVFGFVLGVIQMILYQYYKRRSKMPSNQEISMSE